MNSLHDDDEARVGSGQARIGRKSCSQTVIRMESEFSGATVTGSQLVVSCCAFHLQLPYTPRMPVIVLVWVLGVA